MYEKPDTEEIQIYFLKKGWKLNLTPLFNHNQQLIILDSVQLKELIHEGIVVDASGGGLVKGRAHTENGIWMVKKGVGDNFFIYCNMQGNEYISKPFDVESRQGIQFKNWNDNFPPQERTSEYQLEIPEKCKEIQTSATPFPMILVVDNQFVINRYATSVFIDRIVELDV